MAAPYRNPLLEDAYAMSPPRPRRALTPPYADPLLEEEDPYAYETGFHVKPRAAAPPMPEEDDWTPPQVEMSPMGGSGQATQAPVDDQVRAAPPNQFESDYNTALSRRSAHAGAKPRLGDKQYERPTWQKVLMMAGAGAAGYVNAGGRTHIQGPSEELMRSRPKYEAAMDDWTADGRSIDLDLANLKDKNQMGRQAEQDFRANRAADDSHNLSVSHGKYYEGMANRQPQAQRPPADQIAGDQVWDPVNKRYYPNSQRTPKPGKETPEETFARHTKEADTMVAEGLLKRGSQEYAFYRANGKLPNPQRPRGGGSTGPRPQLLIQIKNRRSVNLRRAQNDYQKKVDTAFSDEAKRIAATELEQENRRIQEDYEDQILTAGGDLPPEPYTGPPPGSERTGAPPVAKPPLPGPMAGAPEGTLSLGGAAPAPPPPPRQAPPAVAGPSPVPGQVKIKHPVTGEVLSVPADAVQALVKAGGIVVQ